MVMRDMANSCSIGRLSCQSRSVTFVLALVVISCPGHKMRFHSGIELGRPVKTLMFRRHSRHDITHRRNISTCATGSQQNQMLPCAVQLFLILLALILLLSVDVQAQQQPLSSNPDLDFGWVAVGKHDPGHVPNCQYCVNADGSYTLSAADEAIAPNWNRTVHLYRCNGVDDNEKWAYQNSTSSFVYGNSSLCLDAVIWNSQQVLTLRTCNSSVFTQRWTWDEVNYVRSNLTDPGGNSLYLWGQPPDKGTNPGNQVYTYALLLFVNSSVGPGNGGTGPNVPLFTFISNKNFINASNRFTTEGLLQISNSSPNQISNGGFENTTIQAGSTVAQSNYNQQMPDYFALCGWVIDYGPIDYVGGLLPFAPSSPSSTASIHLNTYSDSSHHGSISQTIRMDTGTDYSLSFWFTGLPPQTQLPGTRPICNASYTEALLQVQVSNATATGKPSGPLGDATLTQIFSTNVANINARSSQSMNWTQQMLTFKASTNMTRISFSSLNINDYCGPMIAMVTLTKVKKSSHVSTVVVALVGALGGLAVLLALLGVGYGIRYYRTGEDYSDLYKTDHSRWYSLKELKVATKNFNSVLGEGGFGTVYKAEFPDGTAGAVKVEKPRGPHSSSKVLASDEIAVLLRVHHRNLVNLIGFCIHKGQHYLVFEFLPNGSLHDRLHTSILPSPRPVSKESAEVKCLSHNVLPWKQRVKIAVDVAWGLEYLHHEADPPIVHRDVKAQNILLTTTDAAKLADFGLSKAAPLDATTFHSVETMVRGSIGYMDPQYFLTGVFSPKCDVYSFGVVLLELISGHPAVYNQLSLASWATPFMTSQSLYYKLVDRKLNGEFDDSELESLVDLTKMCIKEDGKLRPSMREVVGFLSSRQIAIVRQETSEWMEETLSRESYHKKMKPMSIDFDSKSSSAENFLSVSSPQPRD